HDGVEARDAVLGLPVAGWSLGVVGPAQRPVIWPLAWTYGPVYTSRLNKNFFSARPREGTDERQAHLRTLQSRHAAGRHPRDLQAQPQAQTAAGIAYGSYCRRGSAARQENPVRTPLHLRHWAQQREEDPRGDRCQPR